MSNRYNINKQTRIQNSTVSSSSSTGALTVTGGVGISGNTYIGGNIYQNNNALPVVTTGTFSGSSTAIIPLLFNDSTIGCSDVTIFLNMSAQAASVTLSGNSNQNGSGTAITGVEQAETAFQGNNQANPFYTQTGIVARNIESAHGAFINIRVVKSRNSSSLRNYYTSNSTFTWSTVHSGRLTGYGWLGGGSNGTATLGSLILTASSGTMSGSYSVTNIVL